MSSGVCGVFVYGLEDEFLEVCFVVVDLFCELVYQNLFFVVFLLDFLVDMMNDEIESVWLSVINSLCKISEYIQLCEDQFEILFGVLEDFLGDIREVVWELLCYCVFVIRVCFYVVIYVLLGNLLKYFQDRLFIWR